MYVPTSIYLDEYVCIYKAFMKMKQLE